MSSMGQIEHVVVLMLENRSFDSLLGWVYENDTPEHNIPTLKDGERAYDGLQGLNLNDYGNEAKAQYDFDMSLRGVLAAGNTITEHVLHLGALWATPNRGMSDRDLVIENLMQYTQPNGLPPDPPNSPNHEKKKFFEKKSDDELVDMAAAVLYLLGRRARRGLELKTMTPENHRNTVVVEVAKEEMQLRETGHGRLPVRPPGDYRSVEIQLGEMKRNKDIVEMATKGQAWVRLRIPPIRGANALNCPNFSPGEEFSEVTRQLYGAKEASGVPQMKGFVEDYVEVMRGKSRGATQEEVLRYAKQVMSSYTPDQLPVLTSLARHYAVCDRWFSSVPSQTNPNRAFAFCGTSNGLVNNGFLEEDWRRTFIEQVLGLKLGDDRFNGAKTIFNALAEDNGKTTWRIYYRCGILQDNIQKAVDILAPALVPIVGVPTVPAAAVLGIEAVVAAIAAFGFAESHLAYLRSLSDASVDSAYSYRLFPELRNIAGSKTRVERFEEFHKAARAGTLPNFTFIEPVWSISGRSVGGGVSSFSFLQHLGDDYHPPCNLDGGETLVASVYESLIANPKAWKKTLFIITFDEPVGSFDHVPPPSAVPPWPESKAPRGFQEGFKFDRYGARVPTLLISPLIEKGTVFRSATDTPYDHTSLIATVLKWRGLDNKLSSFGARAERAPTFENVLTRTVPRTDARDVGFLARRKRQVGSTVRYFDRFYLLHENDQERGWWISKFEEDRAELGIFSVFGQDPALNEYFPTVSDQKDKRTEFYFVDADDRTASRPVKRLAGDSGSVKSRVKLVAVDHGLGSYNVLGAWRDSWYCYYSNDYIEGDHDRKERWVIAKPDWEPESANGELKYGEWITLENEYYPGKFIGEFRKKWVKYESYRAKWKVMPIE